MEKLDKLKEEREPKTIEEFVNEINSLGDFKDPAERDAYMKVLAKIVSVYNRYQLPNGKSGFYPNEVYEAIASVCSQKFPSEQEMFDEKGELREGMPDISFCNYILAAQSAEGIHVLGERTNIDKIAKEKFKIDVYDNPATEEGVKYFTESAKKYLADRKKEKTVKEKSIVEPQVGGPDIAELAKEEKITSKELAPVKEKGIKAFIRKMINKIKGIGE